MMNNKAKMRNRKRSKIIVTLFIIWIFFFSVDFFLVVVKDMRPIFVVRTAIYKDGGSKEYLGLGYKVIKFNSLDGRKDSVMGTWTMNINDLLNNNTPKIYTDFSYELYRIHYYLENDFPKITRITSVEGINKEVLNSEEINIDNQIIETILHKYNTAFFENNSLIQIILEEPSGSISHELETILSNNKVLTININRIIPEEGTDDMAWWLLLIEVKNEIANNADKIEYNIIERRQ